jgi:UDP-N-acetylmuramate dehydrogenase
MDVHTAIPLKNFTTMHLGGPARFFSEVHTPQEVQAAYKNALEHSIPVFVVGGGSNLIAHDEGYDGLIMHIRIDGFTVLADDSGSTTIQIGAGEVWDTVVKRTVEMNLSGIEAMSAIPGLAGAAPVQNVGAYGQEIADTLQSLTAYDTATDSFVTLSASDCNFSYRNSIFRETERGRYIITSLTLKLSKTAPQPPFYESLQAYLDAHKITFYTPETIREAVIAIRAEKLPDPSVVANSGSFFKNSVVEKWQLNDIKAAHPDLPTYAMADGRYKVPTGWLIDHAGLKGKLFHGMRVYEKNALVLVNESAAGYNDLAAARDEISGIIRDTFHIYIEQEPLEII